MVWVLNQHKDRFDMIITQGSQVVVSLGFLLSMPAEASPFDGTPAGCFLPFAPGRTLTAGLAKSPCIMFLICTFLNQHLIRSVTKVIR